MRRIPLALKLAWTAWTAVWAGAYAVHYGAWNFLWFCDVGNFVLAAALWLESPLLFSWQSVSLLVAQLGFCADITARAVAGRHLVGGTEFLFDPAIPLWLRLLTLFHVAVPPLLVWSHFRLGYDRRAFALQVAAGAVVLAGSYAGGPVLNINWVYGPFGRVQTWMPAPLYAGLAVVLYALVLWGPTHLVLRKVFRDARAPGIN